MLIEYQAQNNVKSFLMGMKSRALRQTPRWQKLPIGREEVRDASIDTKLRVYIQRTGALQAASWKTIEASTRLYTGKTTAPVGIRVMYTQIDLMSHVRFEVPPYPDSHGNSTRRSGFDHPLT